MDEIASRIFELAGQKGISGKQLAQLLGTTDKKVSAWKTDRAKTYKDYYDKLAEVLDTTVDYLRTGASAPAPSGLSAEDAEILRQIHDRPGLRILLSRTSKASDEDINMVVDVVEAVLKKLEGQP